MIEVRGIDSPVDCSAKAVAIKAAGYAFVGRYYRKASSRWAPLTLHEAGRLKAAGLEVVALWEAASDTARYFTRQAGVDDGASACRQAEAAGQPAGTPIYFAVDFDASAADVAGPVSDYFHGVAESVSTASDGFAVGAYGSGRTCGTLKTAGLAAFAWLSCSTAWAGSAAYAGWSLKQGRSDPALKFNNDTNVAKTGFGGF